jgi:hypothetical protein
LNEFDLPDDLTPSICEEALNRFSQSEDSLAGVIADHHIDVRDFMILSLICDQDEFSVDQLTRALGLGREAAVQCIETLMSAGLLRIGEDSSLLLADTRIQSTAAGRVFTRRILDNM